MGALMGLKIALIVIPFVTIPSVIYGVSHFLLMGILLPVGFLLSFLKGRLLYRKAILYADIIAVKLSPLFLILFIPIILYIYVWQIGGWIFFGWMIIYFISRKYSRVSIKHEQLTKTHKDFDVLLDRMDDRTKND